MRSFGEGTAELAGGGGAAVTIAHLDPPTAPPINVDPYELAARLKQPAPTEEQAVVIAAPVAPSLVVAGAGAGKTETMASRVLWLAASGSVRPESVLGLTFTRKAAAELAHRLRRRLAQLRAAGGLPFEPDGLADGEPEVATYHSYAGRIVSEHGLRIGIEPSARLLGEAASWQLAHRVVRSWEGPMDAVDLAPATVVAAVVALSGQLADHLVTDTELAEFTDRLVADISELPRKAGGPPGDPYAEVRKMLDRQRARGQLLPIIAAYQNLKRDGEMLDFGDQMRLAARLAEMVPQVGATERQRYRAILLDEYQDTGHAQLVLLRSLFGDGHPVTAVGDPCQSIYSWRGASAGTLARFPAEFRTESGQPAARYALTTSFRNTPAVLAVANRIAGPLRDGGFSVDELTAAPGSAPGQVRCAVYPTVDDETVAITEQVKALWDTDAADRENGRPGRSIAVLCRKRTRLEPIAESLRRTGIPVEVVGIGGLLSTPEVRDLVATLRVVVDPSAGDALMRLLTGARWRIGPRDVQALGRWARRLAKRDREREREAAAVPNQNAEAPQAESAKMESPETKSPRTVGTGEGRALPPPVLPDELDVISIVDALDRLPAHEDAADAGFSAVGYGRLRQLAAELSGLRRRASQPLPDLVADTERTLRLNVEVAARPGRSPATARSNLDRFSDVCADYVTGASTSAAGDATLAGFLDYLAAAEQTERGLEPGEVDVDPDRVQLLTVHGAKGLEWDAVFVPGLVDGFFPAAAGEPVAAWTRDLAELPYPLRGDRDFLPVLHIQDAVVQKDVEQARKALRAECGQRDLLEERRLAYVAMTRARGVLVCTGYRWDQRTRPTKPADFLVEAAETCERVDTSVVLGWAPEPAEGERNPVLAEQLCRPWPYDPLAARRDEVADGAHLVDEAIAELAAEERATTHDNPQSGHSRADHSAVDQSRTDQSRPGHSWAGGSTRAGAESSRRGGRSGRSHERDQPESFEQQTLFGPEDTLPSDQAWRIRRWRRDVDLLLMERARRLRTDDEAVPLPTELSVSRLVTLRRDPAELARMIRRPVPYRPEKLARRGTAFHAWLERRFGADVLLDLDAMPGSADAGAAPDTDLSALQAAFEASAWADRSPYAVEVPFQTVLSGYVVRGRMDAVFRVEDGRDRWNSDGHENNRVSGADQVRWEIVDWKTGSPPRGTDAEAAAVQLAAYRLAWSALRGIPVETVSAAFHYVRANVTVRPTDLMTAEQLTSLITDLPSAGRSDPTRF